VTFQLDKRFQKKVRGLFGKYEFQVGVLQDAPYRLPKRGVPGLKGQEIIKQFAGGPARGVSRNNSGKSIADVSKANRQRLGFNYLIEPFRSRSKSQADILRFSTEFFKLVFGRSEKKRCENLLQAIVRNPILRGDYGSNSPLTQRIKGFNRYMIDTAQLFKAIRSTTRVKK
jgi:hypothetical protein